MAPGYLQCLEERPGAAPGRGVLLRLAAALGTTVRDLTGGDTDLPHGLGQPARSPGFGELSLPEQRALLHTHGAGRHRGAHRLRARGRTRQPDRIDDAFSRGWSVLVRGHARTVTDPDDIRRLADRARSAPWAGWRRDQGVRIDPLVITGRRITV
ncbi:pyridoxamine 5'-phosphate oxidase family protein [Streptomyces sp. NPDC054833]